MIANSEFLLQEDLPGQKRGGVKVGLLETLTARPCGLTRRPSLMRQLNSQHRNKETHHPLCALSLRRLSWLPLDAVEAARLLLRSWAVRQFSIGL